MIKQASLQFLVSALSAEFKTYLDFVLDTLSKLSQYYVIGDVHTKQLLLGSIFSKKLVFENKPYRTIPYNEVVSLIMNTDKALEGSKTKKALQDARLSAEVEDNGFEPMTSCMPCKRSTN
jgi:hypothetical protein